MPEITVRPIDDGACWRVTFSNTKGNILDRGTMAKLTEVFREAGRTPSLKAICLEGAGRHFSFGASVQEHLPDQVESMLSTFRDLVFAVLDCNVVVMAAVRGQCLGGGLELATLCHRIFAAPDAAFGQPEIALGVFAPIASLALTERVGRTHAEDLCLTGRTVDAGTARGMGLADEIDEDPAEAALAWARTHFGSRSASSLRHAVRAVRADLVTRLRAELPPLEQQYLKELMKTSDAVEGLTAFIEKRPANWRHA